MMIYSLVVYYYIKVRVYLIIYVLLDIKALLIIMYIK